MSAIDWFWTGRNNLVDGRDCGIRWQVGPLKVAAYWAGVIVGCFAYLRGASPHN